MTYRIAMAMLGALALGGCAAGTGYTYGANTTPAYRPSEMYYAASLGPTPAAIVGTPFAGPPEAMRAGLVAAMQGANYGHPMRFVEAPVIAAGAPMPAPQGYRVIMAFGQPGTGYDLCRIGATPAVPAFPGGRELHGAFCIGPNLMSELYTQIPPEITGAADPAFRARIAAFMVELMPTVDRQRVFSQTTGLPRRAIWPGS